MIRLARTPSRRAMLKSSAAARIWIPSVVRLSIRARPPTSTMVTTTVSRLSYADPQVADVDGAR